jgi:hypothetical protein
VSVPRVTQPAAPAQAPQRTGVAMAVIMTGVLMTAVDSIDTPVSTHRYELAT